MQLKKTLSLVSALTVATLLISGCNEKQPAPKQETIQKVGVFTVKAKPYTITTDLPGRTAAYHVAEVRPQVEGIILKRLFVEGSEVKAGQQLYQIDPAIYQANVKNAAANLAAARSLEKRYRLLVKDKAVSQQQYDDARSALLQAEAALETAQVKLKYTKVFAPITGKIGRSIVTEGALVTTGQTSPMAVINQLNPIYVDITQSSSDILRLKKQLSQGNLENAGANAAKVKLILEDESIYPIDGKLEFSEVYVDETTGSVTLRAIFENPSPNDSKDENAYHVSNNTLLPGMYVRARLNQAISNNAILAPQLGVSRNTKGQPTALIVNDKNEVELRILQVERVADQAYWLVTKGLNNGDRVIIEGLQYVQPGMKVEIIKDANNNQGQTTKQGSI